MLRHPRSRRLPADGGVYFYPHDYLRDRQLDTVRRWPASEVVNLDEFLGRDGQHVTHARAVSGRVTPGWRHRLPLPNIKRRPGEAPDGATVYLWGGVTASGPFIVDLDNPYALVGYNLRALPLWRWLLRRALLSDRCREIRCLSRACRETLGEVFGHEVAARAVVTYPCVPSVEPRDGGWSDAPRLLFVGSQFEMKGGESLLHAFRVVRDAVPSATLDIVTHLPAHLVALADQPGVRVHSATYSPDELHERFFREADVLVHPTFVESFGMVVLEALAHGLAVVSTDVYALAEMVEPGANGALLDPPISIWNGAVPSPLYYRLGEARRIIARTDRSGFEAELASAIVDLIGDRDRLEEAKSASRELHAARFRC